MKILKSVLLSLALWAGYSAQAGDSVVYEGKTGPGLGKHIVWIAGDEEYRSEEGLPMLAKILAYRHGFKCTVLFSIDSTNGTIHPNIPNNTPGLEALKQADMAVILLRFRELPDDQMKLFVDFLQAGKPLLALRTSTHSFAYAKNKSSPYARFDWQSKEWPGGFGQQVLGDTWINHHGNHGKESTRAIVNEAMKDHPILRGVDDVWGPTDVYGIVHLPADAQVLLHGLVLEGMKPTDKPLAGPKNSPPMPVAWVRDYKWESGNTSKIITTTMGASVDLENAGLRRFMVNACYWGTGLADKIDAKGNVDYIGGYKPSYFGFNGYRKGVKPSDLAVKNAAAQ
jgi:hypothetical protein